MKKPTTVLREGLMSFLKFAAVLAAITAPFLLPKKEKEENQAPQIVESDEIFDEELTIE